MRSVDGAMSRTSNRSGNELGAAPVPTGVARPTNSRKLPEASTRRDHTELFTVTVPPSTGASNAPRSDRSASMTERKPSG